MLTFMQHQVHFMLEYKRGHARRPCASGSLEMALDYLEGCAVEDELSESICPKSKRENVCPFLLPQNFTRLRWQAALE